MSGWIFQKVADSESMVLLASPTPPPQKKNNNNKKKPNESQAHIELVTP